jgi:hypothetical protein
MAAHRYWRIAVTAADGSGDIRIIDLELRESAGGADATGSGTASANNNYFGSPPADAFDGQPYSCWSIFLGGAYLKYDFGAGVTKDIVEAAVTTGLDPTTAPKDFTIEHSDDDSAWTAAMTLTGITGWSQGQRRTFNASGETSTPDAAASTRYWRLVVTAVNGGSVPEIAKLQLRATAGGADVTGSGTAFSGVTIYYGTPSNAFDSDASSVWSPDGTSTTENWALGYDFGSGNDFDLAVFAITAHQSDATLAPTAFELQRSEDKLAWTTDMTFSGITGWSAGQTRWFDSTGEISDPGGAALRRPVVFICT